MHNDKIDLRSLVRCIHKSNKLVFKWRKSYIVLSCFFSLALGLLPIMSTLVMQQVLNAIQMHNTLFQKIAIHVIVYIIIEILIVILNLRYRYETNKCFRIINKNIQLSIMRKAGEMRLTDFENAEIHNKLKRAQEGANSICSFISGFFAMLSVLASVFSSCYNIFASEEWQPATSRGISLLKLLEWEGNGLTLFSKGFVPVIKSVSHLPIRSVRFVQVEPRVRVTKQIESAMGKDGSVHCKFFQE